MSFWFLGSSGPGSPTYQAQAPAPDTWVPASKGDAAGSVVENSAESLTIQAQGTTDEIDIAYAYQSVASGDIQLVALIPDKAEWAGHNETFTSFGIGLTEGTDDVDWFAHALTYFNSDGTRVKSGTPESVLAQSGLTGQTYPRYLALTYDVSETEVRAWESADGEDWFQIGDTVIRDLSYPVLAYVFGTSHDPLEATTVTITEAVLSDTITISPSAPRNVSFTGDFESEQVNVSTSSIDGFRIRCARDPQSLGTDFVQINDGGAGPEAAIDMKVVASETPPDTPLGSASSVSPRTGGFFLRSAIYKTKDYTEWAPNPRDAPRTNLGMIDHPFDFDVERYLGFSIYLPENYEIEGSSVLFADNAQVMEVFAPPHTGTQWVIYHIGENWRFKYHTDDSSVDTSDTSDTEVVIGTIEPDRGKWTDFVIRYRLNPFTTSTNASTISGGKDQVYAGNKGILQVWKSEGDVDVNGNRAMVLKISIVDAPVGLVPTVAKPAINFRQYKGNWKSNGTSTITGPIWAAYDSIFDGGVIEDGTTFSDVHAGRLDAP